MPVVTGGAVAGSWTASAQVGRPRTVCAGISPARVLRVALLALVAGNLGRAPVLFHGPEWPVLLNDLFVAAVVAVTGLACLQARQLRLDAVVGASLLFACVGFGAAVWAGEKYGLTGGELAASLAYLGRWLAYLGVYVATVNVIRDDDVPAIWGALERAVLIFAAFGIVQVFAFPGFAQLVYPAGPEYMTWDIQGRRLVSTLLDPNFAGIFVALPLLILLAQLSYGVRVRLWKPVLLLTAMLLTVSRGTMLAFAVGVLIIVAVRGVSKRLAKGLGVATLVLLPFVPALIAFASSFGKFSVDDSAMARVQSWTRALTVVADNPVFGVGFNTYGYVQRAYGWELGDRPPSSLDGGLLFVMVITGAVGVVLYLVILGLVLRRSQRVWRDGGARPEARGFALGTAAATVALVLHSITVNSLLMPFIMEPFWVFAGLTFLYARARSRERAIAGSLARG